MPINVLNRFGPISFDAISNRSSGSAINSLLSGIVSIGGSNYSLSSSYTTLNKRVGNSDSDISVNPSIQNSVGVGIINDDTKTPIRFSEFYGASYLSSSFKLDPSNGTCDVKIYSPSLIVNNNFLTNNGQDQVFKYTLYGKTDVTIPISDTGWNKLYSYSKAGDNLETFYNLVSSKAYKIVAKDCFSNAFTSSMFIGTCTNTNTNVTSHYYNISSTDLNLASSLLMTAVTADKTVNGYTQTQINDINTISKNLSVLINNPSSFRTQNSPFPVLSYRDTRGNNRNLTFDGLIFQKRQSQNGALGGFYNGLVTATSDGGSNPTYQYSFENTSTFGQIYFYILSSQTSTGVGCTSPPAIIGNFPSIISFQGPRCGILDCGIGKPQPVCNPTQLTQVNHSGSFTITNNNNDDMIVSISPDWTLDNGDLLPVLIQPVAVYPSNNTTIPANSTKTFSSWFGVRSPNETPAYSDPNQPVSFVAKTYVTLTLPESYDPYIQVCEIKASFDKNSCIVTVPPPVVVPQTSNVGCVTYNSLSLENWNTVKFKCNQKISSGTGTTNDKTLASIVVNAIPSSGCNLPTIITEPGSKVYNFVGRVDHTLRITLKGSTFSYSNEQYHGNLSKTSTFYNGGIPSNSNTILLTKLSGRGTVSISQQPTAANSYTCIVDISDPYGGEDSYSFDLYASQNTNLTWTLDDNGQQAYVCNSTQFSGTYSVSVSNPVLGTESFYILFLRKNDNNLDAESYINLCQLGGITTPGSGGF